MASLRRTLTLASALAAVMCALPAGASAVELACGATITEDTVLTADVVCAENETGQHGYALLVGADNLSLDLRDHQVGSDWHQAIGVVGRSGVTITAYGGFNSYAIELRDTTDSHIQGVRVLWLDLQGSGRNRITHSQATSVSARTPTTTWWSTTMRAERAAA